MANLEATLREIIGRVKKLEMSHRQPTSDSIGGYWVSMPTWAQFSPFTGAGPTAAALIAVPRDGTLKKIIATTYTQTTNDSGNHWNLTLSDGQGITYLASQSLQTDTADTWTRHEYMTFASTAMIQAGVYITLAVTKTGAPGGIYVNGPLLYFV